MKISPVLLALLLLTAGTPGADLNLSAPPRWRVYFSPQGGCTEAVVAAIGQAKSEIHLAAYSFTSTPIAAALRDAFRRGVKVEVVLDKSQETERYSSATFIAHAGIPTYIDPVHSIMHDKFIVIDGRVVLTGSFNFTKAAEEKNAENLMVIEDPALAGKYFENWRTHRAHSHPYRGTGSDR
jgi:phosphatidylserine/phosphatidylglycerophosphate/cardiolipin synthase-like enzyme